MLHLRLIVPPDDVERVLERLAEYGSVTNVIRIAGAARKPSGDLVLCDVAREDASVVLRALRQLEIDAVGSIAVEEVNVSISTASDEAEDAAEGSPGDAVVWEALEAQTSSSAELTLGFLLLITIATAIATVGILTDSVVLIIGAMVVGPEFGPLAGVCGAVVEGRAGLAVRSLLALLVGFPVAIAVSFVGVLVLRWGGVAVDELVHRQTMFIWRPSVYSVIIALLAGVAGMLSLTTSKSGTLIGVFISVTTIPAAANIAVAWAYQATHELAGSAMQLGVNLGCILVAGILTLVAQRLAFFRRVARMVRDQSRRRGPRRKRPPADAR